MNAPGFFFVWIFMFSALGLAIAGSILLWVYAGFSPRNTPIIEYKGGIEIGINTLNNFSEKKEIHKHLKEKKKDLESKIIEIENGKNGLPSSWNSPDNTPGWLTA